MSLVNLEHHINKEESVLQFHDICRYFCTSYSSGMCIQLLEGRGWGVVLGVLYILSLHISYSKHVPTIMYHVESLQNIGIYSPSTSFLESTSAFFCSCSFFF